jgi:hypothetical protein
VTIRGSEEQIAELYDKLENQDPKLLKQLPMLTDAESGKVEFGMHSLVCKDDTTLYITQSCKWHPKIEDYIDLNDLFDTLRIKVAYEEGANNVYGEFLVEGGSCQESVELTEEQWREGHDEDYQAELKRIQELPYEEFLEEYSDWDCTEEPQYVYLEKKILERIKDEDLPLFVNVEWRDEDVEQAYKNRFSK